ncbi:MAG TPA: serine hydrolase [Thermoanaerobaculia bacterium]|nr:serine hydrolase [Thermoanaerobaculia bacterium]
MTSRRPTAVFALLALSLAVPLRAEAPAADPLAGWDAVVEKALADWRVPGLAVAVVRGDATLLVKGYGLRDRERRLPVTERTLFPVGSATKGFTTFVMGTLAEEGRLDWNAPVSRYLPGFRMKDPFASERMTPTDLVTHRSGLPRHDALWYNATLSRAELVERLRWLEPSKDFRTDFQYSNLMFVAAGLLVERVTGTSWEEAVRARVFAPLGMTSSGFSGADPRKAPDLALPYEDRDGEVVRTAFRNVAAAGPALSIDSTAADLVPWLKLHANGGSVDGRRIARPETVANLHLPRMETGALQTEAGIVPGGYALGWFTDVYRGTRRVYHGADIDGFTALVLLLPERRIGMAFLANLGGSPLPGLLARHLADRLLGLPPREWSAERLAERDRMRESARPAPWPEAGARKAGTKPAHPLEAYAGEYENRGYGVLKVARAGDGLAMTYNGITTPMEHWQDETFRGVGRRRGDADDTFENFRISFLTDATGAVSGLSAPMEPAVADIVFVRRPAEPPAARPK